MKARDNPFATSRVLKVRYQLSDTTWDQLESRLTALGDRAAIVGPHGSGKTTLLEDLAGRLSTRGWQVRWLGLSEDRRRFPSGYLGQFLSTLSSEHFLVFDGAEQLNPLAWAWFKRRTRCVGGLVVTAHRPGLLPTLHTCATHPGLLAGIIERLTGPNNRLPDCRVGELFHRHHGNLRNALRELYDLCANSRLMPPTASTAECGRGDGVVLGSSSN